VILSFYEGQDVYDPLEELNALAIFLLLLKIQSQSRHGICILGAVNSVQCLAYRECFDFQVDCKLQVSLQVDYARHSLKTLEGLPLQRTLNLNVNTDTLGVEVKRGLIVTVFEGSIRRLQKLIYLAVGMLYYFG